MKSTILIKHSSTIQLGHLYEHLFVHELNRYLYDKGLFKLIDYSLFGTTYENGVIAIDFKAYTSQAAELLESISKIKISSSINEECILNSLYQISAEEPTLLYIPNSNELTKLLIDLDNTQWQDLDSISILNYRGARKKNTSIYLTDEASPKPQMIKFLVSISKDIIDMNPELIPLSVMLSRIFIYTVGNNLANDFGLYTGQIYSRKRGTETTLELLAAKSPRRISFSAEDLALNIDTSIKYMLNTPAITSRLVPELKSISYRNDIGNSPDYDGYLQDSNILLGAKGWAEIATTQNIELLIDNMSYAIKLGRETKHSRLSK